MFFSNDMFSNAIYRHDISLGYGISQNLNNGNARLKLQRNAYSIQAAHFFSDKKGLRTGITIVKSINGSEYQIGVPFYFCYRTLFKRTKMENIKMNNYTYLNILAIPLMYAFSLIPYNIEYNIGMNFGYVKPSKNYQNGFNMFNDTFIADRKFSSSIDLGCRIQYKVWRIGIVISPSISYLLTKNYYFKTSFENDKNYGYRPKWFTQGLIGLTCNLD